jgi:5-(carboxyamino)imidazole ribonucleotide synthase
MPRTAPAEPPRAEPPARAGAELSGRPCLLERWVPLVAEGSVVVARSAAGELASWEMADNRHRDHVLRESIVPSGFAPATEAACRGHAEALARHLDVVGLLAVTAVGLGDLRRERRAQRVAAPASSEPQADLT